MGPTSQRVRTQRGCGRTGYATRGRPGTATRQVRDGDLVLEHVQPSLDRRPALTTAGRSSQPRWTAFCSEMPVSRLCQPGAPDGGVATGAFRSRSRSGCVLRIGLACPCRSELYFLPPTRAGDRSSHRTTHRDTTHFFSVRWARSGASMPDPAPASRAARASQPGSRARSGSAAAPSATATPRTPPMPGSRAGEAPGPQRLSLGSIPAVGVVRPPRRVPHRVLSPEGAEGDAHPPRTAQAASRDPYDDGVLLEVQTVTLRAPDAALHSVLESRVVTVVVVPSHTDAAEHSFVRLDTTVQGVQVEASATQVREGRPDDDGVGVVPHGHAPDVAIGLPGRWPWVCRSVCGDAPHVRAAVDPGHAFGGRRRRRHKKRWSHRQPERPPGLTR